MLSGFDEDTDLAPERAGESPPTRKASGPGDSGFYLALFLVFCAAVAIFVWAIWPEPQPTLTQADVDAAIAQALAEQVPVAIEPGPVAYEQIAPSLVVVRAIRDGRPADTGSAPTATVPAPRSGSNLGGGVVVNEQGQVLTANHVVADADSIELVFADGTTTTARIDGNNMALDIAVLSPLGQAGELVPAVLGNSRTLQVGDPIYTVGNPLGLTGTLSGGVISGLDRSIPFPGETDLVLHDLIQFDAAVNQGSSGGPLVNRDGQVIGIITSLADPAGQGFFIGIGFAVPIDVAAAGVAAGPAQ